MPKILGDYVANAHVKSIGKVPNQKVLRLKRKEMTTMEFKNKNGGLFQADWRKMLRQFRLQRQIPKSSIVLRKAKKSLKRNFFCFKRYLTKDRLNASGAELR